jgi:mono/diheme cytochrome c family protein
MYSGPELYETFCASCHGRSGHGDGPVAPLLKAHVPDLTLIAARRGGKFPADEVYRYIDGQADTPTHGPRSMPVWGYEFYGDDPDDEVAHKQASRLIDRLVKQLQRMQRPDFRN